MRYGSVCSGIEAASTAWHPLGWSPAFFSEIERFPCEVLAHHYGSNLPGDPVGNGVPNHGDMTKFQEWPDHAIDLLVGGTPCQSFSVAGLRAGLADPRGNLMLTYLAIAARYRPRWVVWENVPGVLSSFTGPEPPSDLEEGQGWESDEVSDFGCLLAGLSELGYGFAYRVLDAQYVRVDGFERAVPQRRRRVFVVGYLGDWRRAAAVLFDRASLRGDSPPRRETGQGVALTISARTQGGGGLGTDFDLDGGLLAFGGGNTSGSIDVAAALAALAAHGRRQDFEVETFIAQPAAPNITSNPYGDHESREGLLVAHALRAEGFDASEDGTGRGTPIVPVVAASLTRGAESAGKGGYAGRRQEDDVNLVAQDVAYNITPSNSNQDYNAREAQYAQAVTTSGGAPSARGGDLIASEWAVRRLTPLECERLQGFPDGYTAIPRGSKMAADGPRYKALGNSMAVNVMRWIGERVALVDAMTDADEARAA